MKGRSKKKTHFVFTYDSDATLLQLIYKRRLELYQRGTTSRAWHAILVEFNGIHNAQIVQTRTLNNRFKALRKDLNLRITNNTILSITTENERLLVLLNQHFSRKGGKVIEKERQNGHLLPMSHVNGSTDVFIQGNSPVDAKLALAAINSGSSKRSGSNTSQGTSGSPSVSISMPLSKGSPLEGRTANHDSDNASVSANGDASGSVNGDGSTSGDVSPKSSMRQHEYRPGQSEMLAPLIYAQKPYRRHAGRKPIGQNARTVPIQPKRRIAPAKEPSPRMSGDMYASNENLVSSLMFNGRMSQELNKTHSLESLSDNISQFPPNLMAPYLQLAYQDKMTKPADRQPDDLSFFKHQPFENLFTSPRAVFLEPPFIVGGESESRPPPNALQPMRPPEGALPYAAAHRNKKPDPLQVSQQAVPTQASVVQTVSLHNDLGNLLNRFNQVLDLISSLQSNQAQQNQAVTKLHKEFYDFKYEISSKLDQLLQNSKAAASTQSSIQNDK